MKDDRYDEGDWINRRRLIEIQHDLESLGRTHDDTEQIAGVEQTRLGKIKSKNVSIMERLTGNVYGNIVQQSAKLLKIDTTLQLKIVVQFYCYETCQLRPNQIKVKSQKIRP